MLLEVLGAFECLATERAAVRFEGRVDAEVRCDVVALGTHNAASSPLACQAEVVGALATDMVGA